MRYKMRYKMKSKTNLIIAVLGLFTILSVTHLAWSQELMISAGYHHTCAILETGEAKCWGSPYENQTIIPLSLEHAKWRAISVGSAHTCGILEHGEAKCWGDTSHSETILPNGFENKKWKAISAGIYYTCGILEHGEVKCWGDTSHSETILPKGFENVKWKSISTGLEHTCAILENGEAKCWGKPDLGQTMVPPGFENAKWRTISAGCFHTCGILEKGEAKCWGDSGNKQITLPKDLEDKKWKTISAGDEYSCGILEGGEAIHCWGKNQFGQAPPIIRLLPEYPFGISNLELGLEKLMAVVSPVKKAFLERILKILNPLKKPDEGLNLTNLNAFKLRLFLLNALGPFMEDLSSAYEKEHVVPKYLAARKQANAENEVKCLADLECNVSLKLLSLELIQAAVEALKGQTASNEDHALMENLTAELGKCLAHGGENLSQVLGIFDSASGKKLFGAFAQSPFTRGFGLMIQSLVEYLRGTR